MSAQASPLRTFAPLLPGVLVYVLIKLAAVGATTAATVDDVLSAPQTFLPLILNDAASEVVGASLLAVALTALVGSARRWILLAVGAAQLGLGVLTAVTLKGLPPLWVSFVLGTQHIHPAADLLLGPLRSDPSVGSVIWVCWVILLSPAAAGAVAAVAVGAAGRRHRR